MAKVGLSEGRTEDPSRPAWSGEGHRPIVWNAWYPAPDTVATGDNLIGRPGEPLFTMGEAARDAPLAAAPERFPVVLLSHGTGGSAMGMGWLGQRLAARGIVAIGVSHHGNTALEPFRAEGFLCWWERPPDLTFVLDHLSREGAFAGRLDLDRVAVAGFSLGGHTAMALLGAITDMDLFLVWMKATGMRGPREFPDLGAHVGSLLESSRVFRASWQRQSASCLDRRVRAALVCAPAPPVRGFTADSLAAIKAPVAIIVGGADTEAPAEPCARWLHQRLAHSRLDVLGDTVGHYVFLCEATDLGRQRNPDLYADPPGVDRGAIHDRTAELALSVMADAGVKL